MSTAARAKTYTFEDFVSLIRDGDKADLIDGEIYLSSLDNSDANELFGWILATMYPYAHRLNLGYVFASRVAFRIDKYNGPEPDIAFVPASLISRIRRGHVLGGPSLAIEIVSPDSIQRDYEKKRQLYVKAGVQEYWIIDELKKHTTFLRLDANGQYKVVRPRGGVFTSKALPGFWLNPDWLWQKPLPDPLDTLQQILAENE